MNSLTATLHVTAKSPTGAEELATKYLELLDYHDYTINEQPTNTNKETEDPNYQVYEMTVTIRNIPEIKLSPMLDTERVFNSYKTDDMESVYVYLVDFFTADF